MTSEEKQSIYADTLPIVRQCIEALAGAEERNDTRAGRLLLELKWLEQEIKKGALLVPLVKTQGIPTIRYAMADAQFPDLDSELVRLVAQLYWGYPKITKEHYAELETCLADFIKAFSSQPVVPGSRDAAIVDEANQVRTRVAQQTIDLPLNPTDFPALYKAVEERYAAMREQSLLQRYLELRASLIKGFAPLRPHYP